MRSSRGGLTGEPPHGVLFGHADQAGKRRHDHFEISGKIHGKTRRRLDGLSRQAANPRHDHAEIRTLVVNHYLVVLLTDGVNHRARKRRRLEHRTDTEEPCVEGAHVSLDRTFTQIVSATMRTA